MYRKSYSSGPPGRAVSVAVIACSCAKLASSI
jgi:hypothetical protein